MPATASQLPPRLADRPRAGAVRAYDRANLYEYVNGHAEYYLTAGFEGLAVGEYGADAQGQPSLVVNLWDMGKPLHAFGVLMDEAGTDAAPLAGEVLGFRTSTGLSLAHGRYYVQVNSYAPGIDPAVRDRIFRPFVTTKPEGTGLGLALVQKILVTHNGRVTAISPPGQGAVFQIVLPTPREP